MILEIKFDCFNWWSYSIYRTKNNTPIVHSGDGYYSLLDSNDIDSDPYRKLKDSCIKIVKEFSNEKE